MLLYDIVFFAVVSIWSKTIDYSQGGVLTKIVVIIIMWSFYSSLEGAIYEAENCAICLDVLLHGIVFAKVKTLSFWSQTIVIS